MKKIEEAIAIAQQWEDEKATGPAALVGRALLAHINSLDAPQVTDERILVPRDRIEKLLEYSDKEYVPMLWWFNDDDGRPFRATPYFHEANQWMNTGKVVHCTTTASQEAKPVAAGFDAIRAVITAYDMPTNTHEEQCLQYGALDPAIDALRALLAAAPPEQAQAVPPGWKLVPVEPTQEMSQAGFDVRGAHGYNLTYRAMVAAAPNPAQEQAPADKDAIRNAVLEEVALMFDSTHARFKSTHNYYGVAALAVRNMKT